VLVLAAAAVAGVAAVLVVVLRGHSPPFDPAKPRAVLVEPSVALGPGRTVEHPLPFTFAVSMDVRVPRGGELTVDYGAGQIAVRRSRHIEHVGPGPGTLALHGVSGRVVVSALIISDARDGGALLLHRLAELHARLHRGQFPVGADRHDRLHIDATYWTSGFWPGALWQAAALVPGDGGQMFGDWARAATLAHLGGEGADTHDVGFEYGQSSLAAYQTLCRTARALRSVLCGRLKRSVIAAASELLALARSNSRAGTIPTDARGPDADTIIDSMMNIAILPWAGALSRNPEYDRVALRHARAVARLLVRPDGSTIQVVKLGRASGRVLSRGTRQGLSAASTWSRGQGWAVYGFSEAALDLRDRGLLRVALKTAGYVRRRLPRGGIPRWDYDAPSRAPVDVSAGVITAAGMFHLVAACRALPGVCGSTKPWVALGRRLLSASLTRASRRPPLGLLRDQVLNEHGHGCWCNGAELIFGLAYGLEAVRLADASSPPAPARRGKK
jgi:hypothetical protein